MTDRKREERRRDSNLRELLDELLDHVRTISQRSDAMEGDDLAHAQERLEWLADEIWRQVTDK